MDSQGLSGRIKGLGEPFLGERTAAVVESVCNGMLGIRAAALQQGQLSSFIYWLRIVVRSKKLLSEEQLQGMVVALSALQQKSFVP